MAEAKGEQSAAYAAGCVCVYVEEARPRTGRWRRPSVAAGAGAGVRRPPGGEGQPKASQHVRQHVIAGAQGEGWGWWYEREGKDETNRWGRGEWGRMASARWQRAWGVAWGLLGQAPATEGRGGGPGAAVAGGGGRRTASHVNGGHPAACRAAHAHAQGAVVRRSSQGRQPTPPQQTVPEGGREGGGVQGREGLGGMARAWAAPRWRGPGGDASRCSGAGRVTGSRGSQGRHNEEARRIGLGAGLRARGWAARVRTRLSQAPAV